MALFQLAGSSGVLGSLSRPACAHAALGELDGRSGCACTTSVGRAGRAAPCLPHADGHGTAGEQRAQQGRDRNQRASAKSPLICSRLDAREGDAERGVLRPGRGGVLAAWRGAVRDCNRWLARAVVELSLLCVVARRAARAPALPLDRQPRELQPEDAAKLLEARACDRCAGLLAVRLVSDAQLDDDEAQRAVGRDNARSCGRERGDLQDRAHDQRPEVVERDEGSCELAARCAVWEPRTLGGADGLLGCKLEEDLR